MKESDRLEMVKLLLAKTSPNKKNNQSETPLHIAVVEDNRAVALLLVNEGEMLSEKLVASPAITCMKTMS